MNQQVIASFRQWRAVRFQSSQVGMVIAGLLASVGSAVAADGTVTRAGSMPYGWPHLIAGLAVTLLLIISWLWMAASRGARVAIRENAALQKNQQRLQYAFEGANLALWDYDIAEDEIYFSEQMALILGREVTPFLIPRTEYAELFYPEDSERVHAVLKAVLSGEVPSFNATYRVRVRDGEWKWLRSKGKVMDRAADGTALRLTGTIADITMQQRMQQDLQTSEKRWQFALEGSGDGIWDWHVASNEMFVSARWKEMLGYEVDEISNRFEEWNERVHPNDLESCYLALCRHFNHETPVYENELRMRCKDGSYKWILARGKVIEWDENNKPVRIIGTHTDITERRHMQETLRLQARAMEASLDGILIADATQADMPIVYCNKAFETLTGYRREEMLGRNCRFLQGTDHAQPELDKLRDTLRGGLATTVLLRNYHKDGELFWNELSISPVYGDHDELTHFIGISNNVTTQIEAREALRRENEFSTTAINAMPGAFFVIGQDNRVLRLNDNVASITGYSQAELAQMQPLDFYVEEDRALVADKIAETFRDGQAQCEARVLTKSGEIRPFYLQSQRRILDGQECLVGTGTDITVLKQMQQELTHSQSLLNAIVEHIPAMVFLKRAKDLSYVLLNKEGEQILEYTRDEVLGKTDRDLFTPEQAKAMVAVDQEVFATKQARILPDAPFRSPSGWIRYLYTIKTCLCDEQGQPTHLLGIAIDITDRKYAERKLKYSEAQLKEAQHIAKLGNWSLDYGSREAYWSDELFHILGLTPGVDAEGYNTFFDIVHPEDVERVKQSERRAFIEGTPHSLDARIIRGDGEVRWIQIEGHVSKDKNGKPQRLSGTVQDITARKLAEQAVQYSEARLRTILETAVDSIIIIDSKGIIESVNPATEIIFGYSAEEMLGNNVSMLMPEPDSSAHDGYMQRYQATDEARIIGIGREVIGRRKDGSTFPMDLAVSETRFEDRCMYTGFVRDISLRKQAETELLTAKEQAEQASRAKSEFLSNMSHELRTPMNAILGFAQLLQAGDPPLTWPQQQDVKEILVAGQHLLELINGLLDLARIEAGRLEVSIEQVSLGQALNECIKMIEPIRQKHGVTIQYEYNDSAEVPVSADRIRLRQILLNLLSNAVKYNKVGGSVSIRCQKKPNDHIRIEVEDTGIGIAPEYFGELFSAFSRLGAEESAIEGTGIGLAITRQLVELMHGEIGVSSQPGVGSNFWLELPVAQTQAGVDNRLPVLTTTPDVQDAVRTVLYIEDNTANLRFMEQLLRRRPGLHLLIATSPRTGLELAQAHHPDLILLDIHLPDMNGYEVLRHLQGQASTRDIPVIAVSANAMSDDVDRARQAGFVEYCSKPIEVGGFLRILDLILNSDKLVS